MENPRTLNEEREIRNFTHTRLEGQRKVMNLVGITGITSDSKNTNLIRTTKDRTLWEAMFAHVMKRHVKEM